MSSPALIYCYHPHPWRKTSGSISTSNARAYSIVKCSVHVWWSLHYPKDIFFHGEKLFCNKHSDSLLNFVLWSSLKVVMHYSEQSTPNLAIDYPTNFSNNLGPELGTMTYLMPYFFLNSSINYHTSFVFRSFSVTNWIFIHECIVDKAMLTTMINKWTELKFYSLMVDFFQSWWNDT